MSEKADAAFARVVAEASSEDREVIFRDSEEEEEIPSPEVAQRYQGKGKALAKNPAKQTYPTSNELELQEDRKYRKFTAWDEAERELHILELPNKFAKPMPSLAAERLRHRLYKLGMYSTGGITMKRVRTFTGDTQIANNEEIIVGFQKSVDDWRMLTIKTVGDNMLARKKEPNDRLMVILGNPEGNFLIFSSF